MFESPPKDISRWIENLIKDFIEHTPENTLKNQENDKAFETPLVGFSRGDDPLYEAYKDRLSHLWPVTQDYVKTNYKFNGYGCGLCQTLVPCESKIPDERDVE